MVLRATSQHPQRPLRAAEPPGGMFGARHLQVMLGLLAAAVPASATPQLLHTIPGQIGYGGDSVCPVGDELVYTLFYGGPRGPIPIPPWPVRYGELAINVLAESPSGFDREITIAFSSDNTSTFAEFAAFATNGTADDILVGGIARDGGGAFSSSNESVCGWLSLQSYQLDEVRLVIKYLTFSPDRTQYWTNYHWEFWGQTVPEPSTLIAVAACLAAGSISTCRSGKSG